MNQHLFSHRYQGGTNGGAIGTPCGSCVYLGGGGRGKIACVANRGVYAAKKITMEKGAPPQPKESESGCGDAPFSKSELWEDTNHLHSVVGVVPVIVPLCHLPL